MFDVTSTNRHTAALVEHIDGTAARNQVSLPAMMNPHRSRSLDNVFVPAFVVVLAASVPSPFTSLTVAAPPAPLDTSEWTMPPPTADLQGDEILCDGRSRMSRTWIEAETSTYGDDYNYEIVVEGQVLCRQQPEHHDDVSLKLDAMYGRMCAVQEPEVQYRARVRITNLSAGPRWMLGEVCGGQGVCGFPWYTLENVDDGSHLPLPLNLRSLTHSLVRLRPYDSFEETLPSPAALRSAIRFVCSFATTSKKSVAPAAGTRFMT
jgi:hypothetical protein